MLCTRGQTLLALTYVRVHVYLKDVAVLFKLALTWLCFKNEVLNGEQYSAHGLGTTCP